MSSQSSFGALARFLFERETFATDRIDETETSLQARILIVGRLLLPAVPFGECSHHQLDAVSQFDDRLSWALQFRPKGLGEQTSFSDFRPGNSRMELSPNEAENNTSAPSGNCCVGSIRLPELRPRTRSSWAAVWSRAIGRRRASRS